LQIGLACTAPPGKRDSIHLDAGILPARRGAGTSFRKPLRLLECEAGESDAVIGSDGAMVALASKPAMFQ
jgi:hypothetical protein